MIRFSRSRRLPIWVPGYGERTVRVEQMIPYSFTVLIAPWNTSGVSSSNPNMM